MIKTLFTPRFASARLALGAVMISFSAVFTKLVSVGPSVSAFYRVLFGGVMLLAWLLYKRQPLLPSRAVFVALLLAAAFFAGDLVVWHQSIILIGPGLATLLGNFQVFLMAIVGVVFFGERLQRHQWLSIGLAAVGLSLIVGFDWASLDGDTRLGIALGLATAGFYCAYLLSLRRAQQVSMGRRSASADLAVITLLTSVVLAVVVLGSGQSLALVSVRDTIYLLLYGLLSQVFGWILITSALTSVRVARVGLILLLQPVLSFVWDVLIFDRAFTALEGSGAAIALAAIYLGGRREPVA